MIFNQRFSRQKMTYSFIHQKNYWKSHSTMKITKLKNDIMFQNVKHDIIKNIHVLLSTIKIIENYVLFDEKFTCHLRSFWKLTKKKQFSITTKTDLKHIKNLMIFVERLSISINSQIRNFLRLSISITRSFMNSYLFNMCFYHSKNRFLKIKKFEHQSLIECDFVNVFFESLFKYATFSYVWNEHENDKQIRYNETLIVVKNNLHVVLYRYRFHNFDKFDKILSLWMNALCINQKNFEKR